ncbi:hypothetical protein [Fusobacterium necrophorum]|uniref:hypothetical protein n=1 Tax=Fusobacterium necrophorum TaxID=859 RepID=UPI00370F0BBB
MESIKQLLKSNSFFVLNKQLVKVLGIETAFLLSVLSEAEEQLADDEGWFYQTSSTIEEITGLSNHKQTVSIEKLIKLEILEQKNMGVPCKRYFKISFEKIENLVFKNFENCTSKNLKTSLQKISNNKEHNIKNLDKEHIKEKINKKEILIEHIQELDMEQERKEVFIEWIEYKQEIKNQYSSRKSIDILIKQWKNYDISTLKAALEKSIANGYKGLFIPKEPTRLKSYNPDSIDNMEVFR